MATVPENQPAPIANQAAAAVAADQPIAASIGQLQAGLAVLKAVPTPAAGMNDSASTSDGEIDYLRRRMLNSMYCPRLYFYEHVEGVFVHNRETVEGALRHSKVDSGKGDLPAAEDLPADEKLHTRSVTLSSEEYRLIAKMDVIEASGGTVTPVDYKRGSPREDYETGELIAWDPDRVQLAVQALVLRDNGYQCEEAVVYYVTTKQRIRIAIDDALVAMTLDALRQARELAASGRIPPPLVDSPKCPRCSLVGICLPDETTALRLHTEAVPNVQQMLFDIGEPTGGLSTYETSANRNDDEVRRLVPARDDLRPLYLNTQGLRVGKSGYVLKLQEKEKVVRRGPHRRDLSA